jgi:dsDNA-specific endonuclease/ATPase MutS2
MDEKKIRSEEFEVAGDHLLVKVRELVHEGNVRRVSLKREDGSTLIEIPLTAGLTVTMLTVALAPALVAIGAIAAVVSHVTLVVEREVDDEPVGRVVKV